MGVNFVYFSKPPAHLLLRIRKHFAQSCCKRNLTISLEPSTFSLSSYRQCMTLMSSMKFSIAKVIPFQFIANCDFLPLLANPNRLDG